MTIPRTRAVGATLFISLIAKTNTSDSTAMRKTWSTLKNGTLKAVAILERQKTNCVHKGGQFKNEVA